jgi:hypothetical protein
MYSLCNHCNEIKGKEGDVRESTGERDKEKKKEREKTTNMLATMAIRVASHRPDSTVPLKIILFAFLWRKG